MKEYEAIVCLAEPEKGQGIFEVSPNKSLSMYLSVAAKYVECSDGSFDIEAIRNDLGFNGNISDITGGEDVE